MPDNIALYLLLVLALGLGFLLGRLDRGQGRGPGARSGDGSKNLPANYYQGLNYLLDERHELAVDALIKQLQVEPDTFATHLALGALLRRRGETDKAIRVHQNLLASSALPEDDRLQTSLELARDFLGAGLLGRAETLLKDLLTEARARSDVQSLLLDVYVRERDWAQALPIALELADDESGRVTATHIACEVAEQQLAEGALDAARSALGTARRLAAPQGRTQLLTARVALAEHDQRSARKWLHKAVTTDPDLIGEVLPLFRQASLAVDAEADYVAFLDVVCGTSEGAPVAVEPLSERAQFIERDRGADEAQQFLTERLIAQPSLAGLVALLELVEERGLSREQLSAVLQYCRSFLAAQPGFQCGNCGFRAQQRNWLCPSCRSWGAQRAMHNFRSERATH